MPDSPGFAVAGGSSVGSQVICVERAPLRAWLSSVPMRMDPGPVLTEKAEHPRSQAAASIEDERSHVLTGTDGVPLAYRRLPARRRCGRAPVLLLHGLASNLSRWSEFVERTSFVETRDVIRVDLRGHGDSPTRGPINLELWCDDLLALFDAEGIERALLVGHSLGAQVALACASQAPRRVAALVLIDPVFRPALRGKWKWLARAAPLFRLAVLTVRALNAIGVRRRQLPALDLRALDEVARASLGSPQAEAEFIRRYSSTRADLRTFRTAHYLQELIEMFRPLAAPETIEAPTLVLLSTGATFADLAAMHRSASRFPRGEVQTIDCHHWPLTERPDEVRRAIEDWGAGIG
jgi:pimeloyl-ACP methyl ester carboxylesterase